MSEVDLARFGDLSGALLATAGFDLRLRWLSPAFQSMLGYAPDMLVGRPFLELIHPDDVEPAAMRSRASCAARR